ncbi:glutamyl-tRNA reductase [Mangrovibacterium lignilyticum]|uniref:glutamyl-tRNA reductase n=1 Tax=Mangrovibacterium lignilyticum TaxID=2668052 RepID=UPI0013D2E7E8|nr:hypothetical protein [Mangrovibacterium lignilyticum]
MEKSLKYISTSHHTASLADRECFHLTKIQQFQWYGLLRKRFRDISGSMVLSTCNRTEIYVESVETTAAEIRDFFISNTLKETSSKATGLFQYSNSTNETLCHLLHVANGLNSAIVGDGQILGQIKEAWFNSIELNMRGSLLERAMQSLFKTHKRVVNETKFHQGTQSTAYKALKLIAEEFGKSNLHSKKLLIIGAGDIGGQILRFLPKFAFQQVFIANRTHEKAVLLAAQNNIETFDWQEVENNNVDEFDALITAVSNRPKLIKRMSKSQRRKIMVDLAMPANIDRAIANGDHNKLFSLDLISGSVGQNKLARQQVEELIANELNEFSLWYQKRQVRTFLRAHKQTTAQLLNEYLNNNKLKQQFSEIELERLINRISGKLVKETAKEKFSALTENLTVQNLKWMMQVFATQKMQYEKDRGISC